jgi:excinuclease ABC subunit A
VDRIVVKQQADFDDDDKHRLTDSIGTAFYEGEGDVFYLFNLEV